MWWKMSGKKILLCLIFYSIFLSHVCAQSINDLFKEKYGKPNSPVANENSAKPLTKEQEIEKARQRDEASAKLKAQREMEADKLAAQEAERVMQRDEAAARLRMQREIEAERLASQEAEKARKREEAFMKLKLEREAEKNKINSKDDPLNTFDGAWVSVYPPGPVLFFYKLSLGNRQVSLPNLGQATIRLSEGNFGSNFQMSGAGFNCYYTVIFTSLDTKMVWDFKGGDAVCNNSAVFERVADKK